MRSLLGHLLLCLSVLDCTTSADVSDQTPSTSLRTIISNVYVFDGTTLSSDLQTIVLSDGLIQRISSDDGKARDGSGRFVDGQGGTLLPGLIDTHVHLSPPPSARHLVNMRRQGVTTAFDCGCFLPGGQAACDAMNLARQPDATNPASSSDPGLDPNYLRSDVDGNNTADAYAGPYPELFFSYVPAAGSSSRHGALLGDAAIGDAAEASAWLAARLAEPSVFVKLILSAPEPGGLDAATARRLADGAHAAGKAVVCHAASREAMEMALDAGCDQLHHVASRAGAGVDEALAARIRAAGVPVAPTLVQMRGIAHALDGMWIVWAARLWARWVRGGRGDMGADFGVAVAGTRALYRAGVPLLLGTDATGDDEPVIGTVDFVTGFTAEVELLADEAGVEPVDVLRAATALPARYFGLRDRGVVAPGKRADLVLVRGNPLRNVSVLREVQRVWIGGVEAPASDREAGTGHSGAETKAEL